MPSVCIWRSAFALGRKLELLEEVSQMRHRLGAAEVVDHLIQAWEAEAEDQIQALEEVVEGHPYLVVGEEVEVEGEDPPYQVASEEVGVEEDRPCLVALEGVAEEEHLPNFQAAVEGVGAQAHPEPTSVQQHLFESKLSFFLLYCLGRYLSVGSNVLRDLVELHLPPHSEMERNDFFS